MTTFRAALQRVLAEYVAATTAPLSGHPLARFIRRDWPTTLRPHVDSVRYHLKASPGRGQHWAHVPWLGVFDRSLTTSAQRGHYVVYLIRADGSGCYLALVHGVEALRKRRGPDARQLLQQRASALRYRLGADAASWASGPIDLHLYTRSSLAADYEVSILAHISYAADALPPEAHLLADLSRILTLYQKLSLLV